MIFKNLERSDWLNLIGLVLGLLAAIFFYFGSEVMPWALQTWDGHSAVETAFRNGRDNMARIGFILLGFNFTFQVLALLYKKK